MRGFGRVFQRNNGSVWWAAFYVNGREVRESSGSHNRPVAERLLRQRIGELQSGTYHGPDESRILFRELAEAVIRDYEINRRKSLDTTRIHLRPVLEALGDSRALAVDESRIEKFKEDRLEAGYATATVNRELSIIRRAFRLGVQHRRVTRTPYIQMLKESNARKGFFEPAEFRAVLRELPDYLQPLMTFFYFTGWRRGEILPLRWSQLDFAAGVVRLEPGTTKNDEGREFPFGLIPELAETLRRHLLHTEHLERERGKVIPWVWHIQGRRLHDYRDAWSEAVKRAGLPGRIPHDFRRTAVRNLERAGVPRSVAMKLTGHKTEAVYRRYAITSPSDLRDAAAKLAALHREHGQNTDSRALPVLLASHKLRRHRRGGEQVPGGPPGLQKHSPPEPHTQTGHELQGPSES